MSEEASEEASGTITEIIAPCRLDYTIAAGEAQRPFLHGLAGGKIIKSGGRDLALELEEKGYGWLTDAA